jgi:hypothetical protein
MLYPAELRPHTVPHSRESTNKAVLPEQAIRLFELEAWDEPQFKPICLRVGSADLRGDQLILKNAHQVA